MIKPINEAALAFAATLALAQPAVAQSVTCEQLKKLQEMGKNRFSGIDGGVDEYGTQQSIMQLDEASDCTLDEIDSTYPSFNCSWRDFSDQASADAASSALTNQVKACLPAGYKLRERTYDTKYATGYSRTFQFDLYQPDIGIVRSTDKKYGRHSVRFTFRMDLPED